MVVTILLVAFGYSQISESYRGNIFDDAATAMCIVNLHFGSEWNQCSYDKMYEMVWLLLIYNTRVIIS
jgi:hypothetical protein